MSLKFHLILLSVSLLLFYINSQNAYSWVEDFIEMVISNLTAADNYVLPINNSKLLEILSEENDTQYDFGTFDFIIVGAGSAGTLLANRLTEIRNCRVLLLEAGGQENDFSDIPGMSRELLSSNMNWGYYTIPQTRTCLENTDSRCACPRGKVLGGSSTINVKIDVRGNPQDYNYWEALGNPGWSYENVLPYFIKTENSHIWNGDAGYHGKYGLLDVSYTEPTVFTAKYLDAAMELGLEALDYNGRKQIGASQVQFTIKGNKIASGGRAFIDPFINRRNLNVTLNAFVTKLLIDRKSRTTYGVEFIKNGRKYTAKASKEVIASGGSFNTPQILMLSGIGPKEELDRIGVDTLVDLPVGKNMQDHPRFTGLRIRTNITLFNESLETWLVDYLKNKRPFTAPNNADSQSFISVNNSTSTVPDIQCIMAAPTLGSDLLNVTDEGNNRPFNDISISVILLHPKSKGSVTLKSNDPIDFPNIDFNYYSDSEGEDVSTMIKGINATLKFLETKAFKSFNATFIPTVDYCKEYTALSDEYWKCFLQYTTVTIYHPVGTTRMGNSTEDSVVDYKLRVHGITNLRVIDAGIMPAITSGNTNAPTYMIAEKAADELKEVYYRYYRS